MIYLMRVWNVWCSRIENHPVQSCGFTKLNVQNSSLKFLEIKHLWLGSLEILALSLEVIVFESLYCYVKMTTIRAPCLRAFHCNNSLHLNPILQSYELLEYNGGLIMSYYYFNYFYLYYNNLFVFQYDILCSIINNSANYIFAISYRDMEITISFKICHL